MELKKVNELFNDCYKLYKYFSQTELSDDDIHEFIKTVDLINKKYKTKFAEKMLEAVIDEIDRIEKARHL